MMIERNKKGKLFVSDDAGFKGFLKQEFDKCNNKKEMKWLQEQLENKIEFIMYVMYAKKSVEKGEGK